MKHTLVKKKFDYFDIMPTNTSIHNNRKKRRLLFYTCPFGITQLLYIRYAIPRVKQQYLSF